MCNLSVFCRWTVSGTWSVGDSRICSSAAMCGRVLWALISHGSLLEQDSWKVRTFHPFIHPTIQHLTIYFEDIWAREDDRFNVSLSFLNFPVSRRQFGGERRAGWSFVRLKTQHVLTAPSPTSERAITAFTSLERHMKMEERTSVRLWERLGWWRSSYSGL